MTGSDYWKAIIGASTSTHINTIGEVHVLTPEGQINTIGEVHVLTPEGQCCGKKAYNYIDSFQQAKHPRGAIAVASGPLGSL